MGHLTLREALASRRLEAFVREQQVNGAELVAGSELERGLALLVTQRRILVAKHGSSIKQHDVATRPLGSEFRTASLCERRSLSRKADLRRCSWSSDAD